MTALTNIFILITLTIATEASIEAFGLPKKFMASNHGIERIHLGNFFKIKDLNSTTDSPLIRIAIGPSHQPQEDQENNPDSPMTRIRKLRQADEEEDDLDTEESIVFRPLFVYRQQVAERNREQRSRNPIYGSYQYGPNKSGY